MLRHRRRHNTSVGITPGYFQKVELKWVLKSRFPTQNKTRRPTPKPFKNSIDPFALGHTLESPNDALNEALV